MLWKKESKKENALYVDIFTSRLGMPMLTRAYYAARVTIESTIEKSDEKSLLKRNEGNKRFGKGEWAGAMENYNESLCFATPGSENVSLAYANRSACFFNLKIYHECLIDINLAMKAGYPEHLKPKLVTRETNCLKHIEEGARPDDFGLKLSIESDKMFPYMADVLKIGKDREGKLVIVAKEDIDVCQTIIVEKAFTTCLYTRYGWRCNICLKSNTNLMPCNKCTVAMFCSDECQGNAIHENECGLMFCKNRQTNGMTMNEVRIMLMVVNMFSDADDLMDFVEQAIKDPTEIPDTLSDERSKYRAFLKLPFLEKFSFSKNLLVLAFNVYQMVLDIPKVSAMFKSQKHRRFLMHLIGHHHLLSEYNSMRVRSGMAFNSVKKIMCSHTGLMKKYLIHSCAPNVFWMDRDGHSVFITIRPIQKGEPILITVFDYIMGLFESKKQRQQMVWDHKGYVCKCARCAGPSATSAQQQQIAMDPDYQDITSKWIKSKDTDLPAWVETFATISRRYAKVPWCGELGNIIQSYIMYLQDRLLGPSDLLSCLTVAFEDEYNE